MFSERPFQITFLISAVIHAAIFLQTPNLGILPKHNKGPDLEVTYLKSVKETKAASNTARTASQQPLNIPSKITAENKDAPPPFVNKEDIFKAGRDAASRQAVFNKPMLVKPDIIAVKKKITLPPVEMDKINNPSYISYYQLVREKIRRAAYQNYSRAETGEVYLSFIISSGGSLKQVQLRQDKSSPDAYLRDIAQRSIKEASPFPSFPKELDYPQLSFNVVISFEIE